MRPRKRPDPKIAALDPNERPLTSGKKPHPNESMRVDLVAALGEMARLGTIKTTEALSRATGGEEFPFTRLSGLEEAISKLGEELHAQYVLSFVPKDTAPGYHALTVAVTVPNVKVRARPGYWAGTPVVR
jgi:hypothetical protein